MSPDASVLRHLLYLFRCWGVYPPLHGCIKHFNNILTYCMYAWPMFAVTCKNKVSCVKKHGGWLICVAMAKQKKYICKNLLRPPVHQIKYIFNRKAKSFKQLHWFHLPFWKDLLFFYVFLSSGWRCLSETVWLTVTLSLSSFYLRWQRERRHTARAVLLPVFNNTGWLWCTDTAESGLKRSDHLLMHMECDKEGMITNFWMNGRRDCVEHKQIHTVWRWRWSPPSDGVIRVTFTSHYQTRIGIK